MSTAITVAGVTSSCAREYTPTVMITSWIRAARVASAIFSSNRNEMYTVTSTMKTIRARMAFSLISSPQVGPTSLRTMSSTLDPVSSARAADT